MSDHHPLTTGSADLPAAFPTAGTRPFPDPRPAGSAVSAPSALRSGLELLERGTLMATLGMEILQRSAQRTIVRMPVEGARQVSGVLHGGATAALVETAASVASLNSAPEGMLPVGADLQVSHVRPVEQGHITAVATPVHTGRRTALYEVVVSDDQGQCVAKGSLRSMYVKAG